MRSPRQIGASGMCDVYPNSGVEGSGCRAVGLGGWFEELKRRNNMSDWKHAQKDESEALARLHFFSVKKKHSSGDLDVRITIQEFATPKIGALEFFARADIELNQKIA